MDSELMRVRGEYVTLQKELKDLEHQVSSEVKLVKEWLEKFYYYGNQEVEAGRYPEINNTEHMIKRLGRIEENHLKADELRERLKQLKPLLGW